MTSDVCAPGTPLYAAIIEFYYREAAMLDTGRFEDWFALFDEDIHYQMPVRTNAVRTDGEGFQDVAFFEDNYASLRIRVKRLLTDSAWAETPPSRTRHFVTNLLAAPGEKPNEFAIESYFMLTRTRADHGYQFFTGRREDLLRRGGGGFKIARRRILLDQTVVTNSNFSVLF